MEFQGVLWKLNRCSYFRLMPKIRTLPNFSQNPIKMPPRDQKSLSFMNSMLTHARLWSFRAYYENKIGVRILGICLKYEHCLNSIKISSNCHTGTKNHLVL